jgi:glycogen synthase
MRLVVVTREYPSVTSYYGGIGVHLARLVPELSRLGQDVHLLVPSDDDSREVHHDGATFHLIRKHQMRRLWPLTEMRWGMLADRWLRESGPFDLVFAPEWGGDAWRYARHKRAGPLVTQLTTSLEQVLRVSSGLPRSRGIRVYNAIQSRLERAQTERSDALLAISRSILHWTRELWDVASIPATVLPNPIDVGHTRLLGAGEPPPGFPASGPVIAFAGRLEPRKGVDVLVEAMREVWERFPDAHLVLAGHDSPGRRGPMSERLLRLAGPSVKRMHLLGHLGPERLYPALAAADVVALPSRWEAFGNVGLEAMALGCAVVLTTGGGFEEYCRHRQDGLLVPPGDAGALAAALIELLDDPELRGRLSSSAAEKATEYDAPVIAARYASFFEATAAGV